jgi:hypothetical protein
MLLLVRTVWQQTYYLQIVLWNPTRESNQFKYQMLHIFVLTETVQQDISDKRFYITQSSPMQKEVNKDRNVI